MTTFPAPTLIDLQQQLQGAATALGRVATDILRWSQRQAELLRRLAAGEDVRAAVDWLSVADEIERLGTRRLHDVENHLVHTVRFQLMALSWPDSREASQWRSRAVAHRDEVAARFTVSMRARIDMARIHSEARASVPKEHFSRPPREIDDSQLPTLDELLTEPEG
jgi:hypothetical protein